MYLGHITNNTEFFIKDIISRGSGFSALIYFRKNGETDWKEFSHKVNGRLINQYNMSDTKDILDRASSYFISRNVSEVWMRRVKARGGKYSVAAFTLAFKIETDMAIIGKVKIYEDP